MQHAHAKWILTSTLATLSVVWGVCQRTVSAADVSWEISPYEIEVWLALEPVPELTLGWRPGIEREIKRVAALTCGSSWNVTVRDAPWPVHKSMLRDYKSVELEQIKAADAEVLTRDKLYLVAVTVRGGEFAFQVRELDPRCEYLGPILARHVSQPGQLGSALGEAVLEAFSPIGRIERVRDEQVYLRMRAGLLAVQEDSPLSLPEGSVLRPVLRKNDRLGQPLPDGVEHVPWTLLEVSLRRPDGLECAIISGLRTPLRTRSSRRVERFALAVRPTYASTTVHLHALQDTSKPLAGYELYWRLPKEKTSTLIGRTDWRGNIKVDRDEHLVKLLYVKNGGRLLARLPIVVGYESWVEAMVPDDQLRLEAEGFLRGMQEELVDLVARRTVLAVRIRLRLEENAFDEAQALLDEMQALPTRDDLDRRLRARRQLMTTKDRAMQDRIDRMFRQTQEILQKHLHNREIEQLRNEIIAARRAGGTPTDDTAAGGASEESTTSSATDAEPPSSNNTADDDAAAEGSDST